MIILATIKWPAMFTKQRATCFTNIIIKSQNFCREKYHSPLQTEKLGFRVRKGHAQGRLLVTLPFSGQRYNLDFKASTSLFASRAWLLLCGLRDASVIFQGRSSGMLVGPHLQDVKGLETRGGGGAGGGRDVHLPPGSVLSLIREVALWACPGLRANGGPADLD